MGKVQKYKGVISTFISSEEGQRFFNFAYSIGAAIVIWGALFKILHLPGGNTLLSIGMGTEVFMFLLTAFDRPPKEYKWEEVFPALRGEEDAEVRGGLNGAGGAAVATGAGAVAGMGGIGNASSTQQYSDQMSALAAEMQLLHANTVALNKVSSTLLESYRAITENSDGINQASHGYVEQMKALHQNLGGLNTIYEIQLESVSSQLDAIDRVNRGIKDIRDMYEKSANTERALLRGDREDGPLHAAAQQHLRAYDTGHDGKYVPSDGYARPRRHRYQRRDSHRDSSDRCRRTNQKRIKPKIRYNGSKQQ